MKQKSMNPKPEQSFISINFNFKHNRDDTHRVNRKKKQGARCTEKHQRGDPVEDEIREKEGTGKPEAGIMKMHY